MHLLLALPLLTGVCDRIDQYVAPLRALDVFSGVVLVASADKIVCERAYGKASIELDVPMSVDNRFRISSVSKSFTKELIRNLADRGKIRLTDNVARWLPQLPSADQMTIQMLLDHRAGIRNVNSLPYDEEAVGPNTLRALIDSIARLPLDFKPGSARRYSNGGYALLAFIIEEIENDSYGKVLQRDILRPNGLTHTAHERDGDIVPMLATGYMPSSESFGAMVRAPFQEMGTKAGGGSLVSNARDMMRWTRKLGDRDGNVAFQGRSPGYNSVVVYDSASDVTVVVLTNNYAAGMVYDVATAALQIVQNKEPPALRVRSPARVERDLLNKIPGKYLPPAGTVLGPAGTTVEIRRSGDQLVAYLGDVPVDVLVPQGGSRFLARALWSMIDFDVASATPSLRVTALYRDAVYSAPKVN